MEWYEYLIIGTVGLYFLCGSLWVLNMLFHISSCTHFETCSDRTCKYRRFCDTYQEKITPDEAAELLKILEKFETNKSQKNIF